MDLEPWTQLQTWMESQPTLVVVPYLTTLAEAIPPVATRLRRDFSAIKALIVAAIFMHLKYSPRINWLFASCGVVFVLIMIAFVVGDVKGEHMQYQAQQWNPPPVAAAAAPQGH